MNRVRRARRLRRTLVRNGLGIPLLCCWDTCPELGYEEFKVVVREPSKTLHYIFCSEAHKSYHENSHRDYGNRSPLLG